MGTGDRDRYLDLLRGGSIVAVVVGHWLVADLTYTGGELHLHSSLGEVPAMWPLTWVFQVIPVFFFVAGAVNGPSWVRSRDRGDSYARYIDRRVRRVLVPTTVAVILILATAGLLAWLGDAGVSGAGAMVLQPLWFLGVYLALVALTPWTWSWHRRLGSWLLALLLAVAVVSDVGRVGFGHETAGYVNVIVVWLLVYVIGYWYADAALTRARAGLMSVVGLIALLVLVTVGPYPLRMVGVPGDRLSNMHPPTLAVLALALLQIGLLVLVKPTVTPWLRRPLVWAGVVWVNLAILTMYLWHQFALVAAGRLLLATGMRQPDPGHAGWWAMRVGWLLIAGLVLVGIVALLGRFERLAPVEVTQRTWTSTPAAITVVGLLFAGLLGLAGTRVTETVASQHPLGLPLSPTVAASLVVAAALVLHADRRGPSRAAGALLLGSAMEAVLAVAYLTGFAFLPTSAAVAATCAVLGVVLVGLALLTRSVGGAGDPPLTRASVGPPATSGRRSARRREA